VVPPSFFLWHDEHPAMLKITLAFPERFAGLRGFLNIRIIGVFVHPDQRAFHGEADYVLMEKHLTEVASSEGLLLESKSALQTPAGRAYCLQFGNARRVDVRCFLDESTLTIFYDGDRESADDVYSLVRTIAPNK
jgi:hypothetical protein